MHNSAVNKSENEWNKLSKSESATKFGNGLQTGMRGAFGKPQGTVARVDIGQMIMSVRAKEQHKEHVIEALRRAKFKYPGRQKIAMSKKWGFTKWEKEEFEAMRADGRLKPDGCYCHYYNNHGPLDVWVNMQRELRGLE